MKTTVVIILILAILLFGGIVLNEWRRKRRVRITWRGGGLFSPEEIERNVAAIRGTLRPENAQHLRSNFDPVSLVYGDRRDPEVTSERIVGKHPALAIPYGEHHRADPRFRAIGGEMPRLHARVPLPHLDVIEENRRLIEGITGISDVAPRDTQDWKDSRAAMPIEDDSGEPLPAAMSAQPNIGGEDHPPYAGPHLRSLHGNQTRFVPYDMLHDPVPGTAVSVVGASAIAGPIADEPSGDY